MAENRCDLVVLGGGSGGYAAALRALGVKTTFEGMDMPGVHKYKDSVIAITLAGKPLHVHG